MRPEWHQIFRRRARPDRDQQVRELVESLPLPSPYTLDGLIDAVAARVGHEIVLHPLYDLPPEISGVSIPQSRDARSAYVICYDATVPTWSQHLIILHELGHHLLGHAHPNVETSDADANAADGPTPPPTGGDVPPSQRTGEQVPPSQHTGSDVPPSQPTGSDVPPGTRYPLHGLNRTSFHDPREVDAEWFATLMAGRIERHQRAEVSPELRHIRRAIEPRHRWTER